MAEAYTAAMRPSWNWRLPGVVRAFAGAGAGLTLLVEASAESLPSRTPTPRLLTNAAMLRALSPEQAAASLPVRLSAVVTALNPGSPAIFVQDQTGGTFIRILSGLPPDIEPGDVIEASGVSFPGRFLPGIDSPVIRYLERVELPAPKPVNFDDLQSGRFHYERVEIRGVVRAAVLDPARVPSLLTVSMGTRKLQVRVVASEVENLPPLVDAEVRIAGLATGYINDIHQLVTPQLLVSRIEDVQVEKAPPADPFSLSLCSASELLSFNPQGISRHRVRVRGLVTHHQPGKALFLRDDEQSGLMVHSAQSDQMLPGDLVEAVGFPAMGRFSAFLDDAEFRKVGTGPRPEPMALKIGEALQGTNEANLVTIEAQLLETLQTVGESILVLRAEDTAFKARLPRVDLPLQTGSRLRVTGICRVEELEFPETLFGASPGSIELLARSPADIFVHEAASWWTPHRLLMLVGVVLVLALAALSRVVLLRRRVAAQAEVIREKLQREAALEERHRVAREIHDTVAQSFSGLGFQLDAVSARLPSEAGEVRKQLETARQIVRHGQESFRRSLMNLRAQELERGRLTEALPNLARQITAGTGIELQCHTEGRRQGLPDAVENNLLRIGQECLTNAVRHGRPSRIEVRLTFEPGCLRMRIADNGCGFDPGQLEPPADGHFGWPGIRERAEQIRAEVNLNSRPGRGTVITVTVPI